MSGTSLDGIDAALVHFSGTDSHLLHTAYHPYPEELRQRLLALHEPAFNELHIAHLTANDLAHRYATIVHGAPGAKVQFRSILQSHDVPDVHVPAAGEKTML